jgi:general stress protein 26
MTDSEQIKRAWDLMESIGVAILVTRRGDDMHGRPMSAIVRPGERRIYFLAHRRSASDQEIADNPSVFLGFSDASSRYVSVCGRAALHEDKGLIQKLWNAGAQAYFPDGPDSPDVVAIAVEPAKAEYWDGPAGPIGMVKIAFAAATGQTPDMGDNAKLAI